MSLQSQLYFPSLSLCTEAKTLTTASNISSSVQEISRVAMASAERYPVT